MKTLSKLMVAVFSLFIMLACTNTQDEILSENLKSGKLGADKSEEAKMVTVPFKANFSVWRALPPGEGEACGEGTFRETMEGHGEIAHLGEVTTSMSFCMNATPPFVYALDLGTFIAANGDELYFTVPSGEVIFNTEDNSDFYTLRFNDEMFFIGGTGRFEGASGSAMSNSFVHTGSEGVGPEEFRTDFFSEGTITLMKGK